MVATKGRDQSICEMLGTNPSELERLLGKSRQTISKYINQDTFFGFNEVMQVAFMKISNDIERSQIISEIATKYFSHVLRYTKDMDVLRFSAYCIFGMHIYGDIHINQMFERFLTAVLEDENKFVLFICLPEKDYVQLCRWLERFAKQRGNKTASFVVIPCKLVELAPLQILGDPWCNDPQLIQVSQGEPFVDKAESERACALAAALREIGAQKCVSIDENIGPGLIEAFNTSYYDNVRLPQKPFGSYVLTADRQMSAE